MVNLCSDVVVNRAASGMITVYGHGDYSVFTTSRP